MKSPDRAVGRKRASPRFSFAWITIGTLGLLTIVFLTQQAIWLNQFGTADWQRRRADLQKGAERVAIAFDEEMQRIAGAFRLEEDAVRRNDWSALETRGASSLVEDVYLVQDGALQRWDASARTFRPLPWPARLHAIQRDFRSAFDETSFSLLVPFVTKPRDVPGPGVVVSSAMIMRMPMERFGGVVITLDRDVLTRSVLPALMKRHLPADDADAPYAFVVKSHRSGNVLLISQPEMSGATGESSDAAVDLLAVSQVIDTSGTSMSFLPSASGAVFGVVDVSASAQTERSAPIAGTIALPRGAGSPRPPALMQMLIRHPAGSLRAAVTQVRRRNLLMSAIALVLLAGSAVAMAISSHRARRLVRQQMEFVGGVTHEVRTPVAVVCMTASNLADGVVQGEERVREYGQLIQAEGQRLSQMIDQILTFAGADADAHPSSRQIVPVANLIEDVLSALASQITEQKFACDVRIDPETPAVWVDAAAARRALQNLLTNAMKYSGDSRRLEISAEPDATVSPPGAKITVRDWGIGIAADELRDIFLPFLRGRDVAQSSIPGSGLGLSIVERIAHAHDGRVSVHSTRGEGSSFTLHLPGIERLQRVAQA